MKLKYTLLVVSSLFLSTSFAQDGSTGIGFRLGGLSSGLTIRHFTSPSTAIEGLFSFGHRSFIVTGLYEKHFPIENAEGLNWFVGGGAHLGVFSSGGRYYIYKNRGNKYLYVEDNRRSVAVGGLDFILGLNYKFRNAPFDLSLDIKPFIDFVNSPQGYVDGALSFRFIF